MTFQNVPSIKWHTLFCEGPLVDESTGDKTPVKKIKSELDFWRLAVNKFNRLKEFSNIDLIPYPALKLSIVRCYFLRDIFLSVEIFPLGESAEKHRLNRCGHIARFLLRPNVNEAEGVLFCQAIIGRVTSEIDFNVMNPGIAGEQSDRVWISSYQQYQDGEQNLIAIKHKYMEQEEVDRLKNLLINLCHLNRWDLIKAKKPFK